jgi:hypothetical protein
VYVLPPSTNPLVPEFTSFWFPPLRFDLKAYFDLCQTIDEGLHELEARYPTRRPALSLERRNKRISRRPK